MFFFQLFPTKIASFSLAGLTQENPNLNNWKSLGWALLHFRTIHPKFLQIVDTSNTEEKMENTALEYAVQKTKTWGKKS